MVATARRVDDLADLAAAGCRTLPLDVTDEASMRAAVDAIEASHGRIDVLVNNAGYSQSGAVESVPLARTRAQFETNVFGPLRLTQLVLPGMRRRGAGRIVNVSSMGGRLVFPGGGVYHASKYALEALSDALRYELRPFGIAVVLIEPGLDQDQLRRHGRRRAVDAGRRCRHDRGRQPATPRRSTPTFNDVVARGTAAAYERGPMARMAGEPIDVARVDRPGHRGAAPACPLHGGGLGDVLPDAAPLAGRRRLGLVPARRTSRRRSRRSAGDGRAESAAAGGRARRAARCASPSGPASCATA